MIRNRIVLKAFAVFCLIEVVSTVVTPSLSWALTAGPTAPEFTSFEPVDTSDMVNLATGDLAYNIPLLEVPGPAGGYPLSLSYHAGIMPEEEASWVGLGWTLNPGAISRTVNGYADDQLGSTRTRTDVNTGSERNTFYAGVGLPYASAGISISNDSNLGVGVGTDASVGPRYNFGIASIDAQISDKTDGYGAGGVGGRIGLAVGNADGLNASVGLSTNFKSVSFDAGVGLHSYSLLGANIRTNGSGSSVSVVGASQTNSRAGHVSTESFGFTIPIPLGESGLFLNLGYDYFRWYIHETSNVSVIGSLYAKESNNKNRDSWSFDSYALIDTDIKETSFKNSEPEKSQGGSFPAYDSYQVNAQGLNGSMHPYLLNNGTLFRQNLKTDNGDAYLIEYKPTQTNFYSEASFRFEKEFSNVNAYSGGQMTIQSASDYNDSKYVSSQNTVEKSPPLYGYKSETGHLGGSRNIEWFSNEQIQSGAAANAGFVNYEQYKNRLLSKYKTDISKQVGGFMITNESGVTYHYSLPVYAYDEYFKSYVKDKPLDIYTSIENRAPYAYTWLLTAVTGPDYYDKNENGIADGDDWGYWVRYDYGMWSDNYQWRNPSSGAHTDKDPNVEFFSFGKKELYYLNAISTKTHTALFEKELRADSKGIVNTTIIFPNVDILTSEQSFGFEFRKMSGGFFGDSPYPDYYDYSTSTLRLKGVYLIENTMLDQIASVGDLLNKSTAYNTIVKFMAGPVSSALDVNIRVHFGENVLDAKDLDTELGDSKTFRDAIKEKALRVISFEHDYSLQDGPDKDGVPNSFDANGDMYVIKPSQTIVDNKLGKLTLNGLSFQGKSGVSGLIPPMKFEYNKNPGYKPDAHDMWGMYKSDYVKMETENLSRFVTANSAANTDAWSLTDVVTSLGSKITINYESDEYLKPELYNASFLNVKSILPQSNGNLRLEFYNTDIDLRNYLSETSNVNLSALIVYNFHVRNPNEYFSCIKDEVFSAPMVAGDYQCKNYENLVVKSIGIDFVELGSSQLFNDITKIYGQFEFNTDLPYPGSPHCYNAQGEVVIPIVTYYRTQLLCGNMGFTTKETQAGGGLRVSDISLGSGGSEQTTKFTYKNGVTSFEPFGLDLSIQNDITYTIDLKSDAKRKEDALQEYEESLQTKFSKLLAISREVPPPGVIYQFVEVEDYRKESGKDEVAIPGKKTYEFQTFDRRMIERISQVGANVSPVTCYDENNNLVPCTGPVNGPPRSRCYDVQGNPTTCDLPDFTYGYSPMTINDYTSWLGTLKSVSLYGPNDQLLNKTENIYLQSLDNVGQFTSELKDEFGSQGKISQSFTEYRVIRNDDGTYRDVPIFSMRNEYPSVQVGQKVTNYKTGITTSTTNLSFDFYTGQPTQVLSTDGYGNSFLSELIPAYRMYAQMGLAIKGYKNMLSQTAATYEYKVTGDGSTKLGLCGANVQTWTDRTPIMAPGANSSGTITQSGVWRMQRSYSWKGDDIELNKDGTYPIDKFYDFDFQASSENNLVKWKKNSEITLYDVNSHALVAKDMNEHYASAKTDYDQTRVLVTGTNTQYDQLAYSGAEETPQDNFFGGNVECLGKWSPDIAHTGKHSVQALNGNKGFGFHPKSFDGKYLVSFWASDQNAKLKYSANGIVHDVDPKTKTVRQAGNWYQIEAAINVDKNMNSLWIWTECADAQASTYFDDFRVQPFNASVVSYVYNEFGELSHILDANNMYTEYRYDAMGRLTETYRETFKGNLGIDGEAKLSSIEYHYGPEIPYPISLNSTTTGALGQLLPAGQTQVTQGSDVTFNVVETCGDPKFNALYIDAQPVDLTASAPIILSDGTQLIVSGKTFTLKNVQTSHTISANFYKPGAAGVVECVGYPNTDGTTCYDGSYRYATYSACGNLEGWIYVSDYYDLPSNLRQYAGNCCGTTSQSSGVTKTYNSSTGCTCTSNYPSN